MTDLLKLVEDMHFTHRNTTATNTTLPVDNCDLLKSGIKALLAENEMLKAENKKCTELLTKRLVEESPNAEGTK